MTEFPKGVLKRPNEASISFPDLQPVILCLDSDDDDKNINKEPSETPSQKATAESQSSKIERING